MITVLDASAGIEIVLNRPKSRILKEYISKSFTVISSELYKAEVTNVFWKYIKTDLISKEKGTELLKLSLSLVDEYHDIKDYSIEALHEATRLNHSSYDMLYFTLARRTGANILTLDKKLLDLAIKEKLSVPKGLL